MNTKLLDSLVQIIHSLSQEEQKILQQKLLINSSEVEEINLEKLTALENDPFVGMWQEREDLEDSSQWVRHLRKQEWIN
ncbi:hypothetical protein [Aphanothece sacrum]|uniref:Uncharacterized protein n=1 Tax=Aphanothece sacrum FPU1 TaxID=1920663 RepID=A0A401INC4_APHSA|nr:hypothetical protein [Aphanothece sacrum]GBF82755.1 hypothetical protein AsFPU1_4189 [Aphanothece sacrum FPU1]